MTFSLISAQAFECGWQSEEDKEDEKECQNFCTELRENGWKF